MKNIGQKIADKFKRVRESGFGQKINWGAFLILPAVLWLSFFLLLPLVLILIYSFATRGVYGGVVYKFTLENYLAFFDPLFLKLLLRSLGFSLLTTIVTLLLGYPVAFFIARYGGRWQKILMMLVIIPFWVNFLIRTYAWVILLRGGGVINSLLMKVGFISEPLNLLYTDGSVLLGLVYGLLPFMILPLYTSLEKLDHSLLEAARDLGANPWRTFWRIVVPQSTPGIVAGAILVFIPAIGMFVITDLMGGAKNMMIGNFIQNQFLSARNWPFGSAAAIIVMAIVLFLLWIYNRWYDLDREEFY